MLRVRRFRAKARLGGGDDGGGGRQSMLFSKSAFAKSKPPKPAPVIERTLFEGIAPPRKAAGRVKREIAVGATA